MGAKPDDGLSWANRPTKQMGAPRFEIEKPKGKRPIQGVCLSGEVTGIMTHWNGSRTGPCRRQLCDQCAKNVELRWKGYVWFRVDKAAVISILELTPLAGEQFAQYFDIHRTLRGSFWKLFRRNGKDNGPVTAQHKAAHDDGNAIPSMPSLSKILKKIWNIDDKDDLVEGPVIRDEIAKALAATNGYHPL